jgi:acyl-CoA synthetase (AMP-forming)/AMP-acid ligase II
VRGAIVSRAYFWRPDATQAAKIPDPSQGDSLWHRMGDLGYFDAEGRLWFHGRMSHRVHAQWGPIDTAPVEGIFDTHPQVARSALVGIGPRGGQQPAVCIELAPGVAPVRTTLFGELRELARRHRVTAEIDLFFIHPRFPVDIRHNAKIDRERLARWAAGRVGRSRR